MEDHVIRIKLRNKDQVKNKTKQVKIKSRSSQDPVMKIKSWSSRDQVKIKSRTSQDQVKIKSRSSQDLVKNKN